MSRYSGWGGYPPRRASPVAPYPTVGSDSMPSIADEDFAYITSEDLLTHPSMRSAAAGGGGASRRTGRSRGRSASPPPPPEDDVLIVKNKGVTYPAHFPAYSIFDGKVRVRDVRDKVGEMMDLSERATKDVKLLYKGKNLSSIDVAVRDYGVKNNSEILAVVREVPRHHRDRDPLDDGSVVSSTSSEDVIVVPDEEVIHNSNHGLRRKKSSRRIRRRVEQSPSSEPPLYQTPNASSLSIPSTVTGQGRRGDHGHKSPSPSPSPPVVPRMSLSPTPAPQAPGGPIEKLDSILASFEADLVPSCNDFMANPPNEKKRLDDDHRKLTETIFQRVLLKLDEVETGGNDDARMRRRQLVKHTQEVLKMLDETKAEASRGL